ncbi:MAG: amidohydrolase family protein [Alphaproteobacteria bacterium]|nr:amidohydrolase family protein [Alphaproteobacteria bacterium]
MSWLLLCAALAADPSETASSTLLTLESRALKGVERTPVEDPPPIVLYNGTVMPASGPAIARGYVVVADGRIQAVGEGDAPQREGAVRIDLAGRFVTPGLIDTHSHLGVYPSPGGRAHGDGNEATAPATAGVWAEHSAFPQDPGFQRAIAGGITALQLLPGSANLVGGRGVVVQNVPTRGSRAMRFPGAPETIKLACGENPKRVYGEKGGPSTRMGNLYKLRQTLVAAEAYRRKWAEYDEKLAKSVAPADPPKKKKGDGKPPEPPTPPDRDLANETLVGVLEGRILPQIHCYRADDMLSMLQVADEFGFRVRSFHHALEAYKIRDILAEREVSVSTWADWWGFKLEAYDGIPHNAALVAEAGGRAIVHSDSSVGIQRLNQEAGKAWHTGLDAGIELPEDEALRWITLNPAWALGIDDQTGSIEVGKRADLVVWDAHPFSVYASAGLVFVDGALRYDKSRPEVWSDFEVGQGAGEGVP